MYRKQTHAIGATLLQHDRVNKSRSRRTANLKSTLTVRRVFAGRFRFHSTGIGFFSDAREEENCA
nr:MAG TPA: hypothetical protein [Caudoviricetes sp.]